MKRTVIISILLAVFAGGFHHGFAQRPVGDTLQGLDSTYFYTPATNYNNWFSENNNPWWRISASWYLDIISPVFWNCWSYPDSRQLNKYQFGNGKTGMQMFTDRPIKIIGIAVCACRIIRAVLNDEDFTASVSSTLGLGSHEIKAALSLPSVIGNKGVVSRAAVTLDDTEKKAFEKSAAEMRDMLKKLL